MNISQESRDRDVVVRINGRLDAAAVQQEKDNLIAVSDSTEGWLVINLEEVDFIDSSGLGLIVSLFRHVRERGANMCVCCLSPQAQTLFELTRMHRIFAIYPTEEAALQACR